jgi:hypothetical protein
MKFLILTLVIITGCASSPEKTSDWRACVGEQLESQKSQGDKVDFEKARAFCTYRDLRKSGFIGHGVL